MTAPVLTICIATYKRAQFIEETLKSIQCQLEPGVELLVVDGASPDGTQQVMQEYVKRFPETRYYREAENSGVDADFNKAVEYAGGDYCWLMTDDDLLVPGAIRRVLDCIATRPDLVVVNAEVRTADFSSQLESRLLKLPADKAYGEGDGELFFSEVGEYLSFIGGVIIRRDVWLARDRASYYGTLFIHVGVIFQNAPLKSVKVIADPLVVIRYGNAMWTPRGFEIWMFKWPRLVWSFSSFSDAAKARVSQRYPWRDLKKLVVFRATGVYALTDFHTCWNGQRGGFGKVAAWLIAALPVRVVNLLASMYVLLFNRAARLAVYDLSRSSYATRCSRLVARWLAV
jgi:abequosyltransferase